MCQNRRLIRNPHDGRTYWTKCGHCDACLQERAGSHRARIRREMNYGYGSLSLQTFFVTLHYENTHLPFIRHSELIDFFDKADKYQNGFYQNPRLEYPLLKVYRNTFDPECIDEYTIQDFEHLKREEKFHFGSYQNLIKYLPYARRKVGRGKFVSLRDCCGVIYQKDIQNFFKLLKIKLFRKGYEGHFSYTYASELGETYCRPHFHALISFNRGYESLFESLIDESWKHADLHRLFRDETGHYRKSIEPAKNPASYVSSYINLRSVVPLVYKDSKCFEPKIKFSQGYGTHFRFFTKSAISEMFYKGDLRYPARQIINGVDTLRMVSVPGYVLRQYFPKFKGFRYLSSDEIFELLLRPDKVYEERFYKKMNLYKEEISKLETYLFRKRNYWVKLPSLLGMDEKDGIRYAQDISDFAYIGSRIWSMYASQKIKDSYEHVETHQDMFEHFDNIKDFFDGNVTNDVLNDLYQPNFVYTLNPNEFKMNVLEHNDLQDRFDKAVKCHRSHGVYETTYI